MVVTCEQCGTKFNKRPSQIKRDAHHHCSRACRHIHSLEKNITVYCEQCGTSFKKIPAKMKTDRSHFCCKECWYTFNSEQRTIEVFCATCNKSKRVMKSKYNKSKTNRFFCNRSCQSKGFKGDGAPVWKGGITPDRMTTVYAEWRIAVHKVNEFTCQKCGQIGGTLEAHHILPYAIYPDARVIVDNGSSLCMSCHKDFHRGYGNKATEEDYFKWLRAKPSNC